MRNKNKCQQDVKVKIQCGTGTGNDARAEVHTYNFILCKNPCKVSKRSLQFKYT